MASIINSTGKKVCELIEKGVKVNPYLIPSCHSQIANELGVTDNWLFYVPGGLGDNVCAEPIIRYVCENFKTVNVTMEDNLKGMAKGHHPLKVSVVSYHHDLFRHLPLVSNKSFYTQPETIKQMYKDFYILKTLQNPDYLHSDFIPHMFNHCVDYVSQICLRMQLPPEKKSIELYPNDHEVAVAQSYLGVTPNQVIIHPGRSWKSKTMPREFWNEVIENLIEWKITPIIIGTISDGPQGTVNVKTKGCIDLRNKLTVMETTSLLQKTQVFLTNDSGPLHLAASGGAWIGFISTAKRPDLVTHWRLGEFGYKTKSFAKGGMWELQDMNPTAPGEMDFASVEDEQLQKWLPTPHEFADWAYNRVME